MLESYHRLGFVNKKWLRSGQTNWAINVINSQNYLYDFNQSHFNCLIGSSISARFSIDDLIGFFPENLFMLPFNGLSVHDGLNVLYRKNRLPDTLFVETNVLERPSNKEFSATIGNNIWEENLKYFVSSLRQSKGPLNLASQFTTSLMIVFRKKMGFEGGETANKKAMEKVREIEIQSKQPSKKKISDNAEVFNEVEDLEAVFFAEMEDLKRKGVVVVLFNMPVDCRNEKGDLYYNRLYAKAKSKGFLVFDRKNCQDYTTTDGTHLSGDEIKRYAEFFLAQRAKLHTTTNQ